MSRWIRLQWVSVVPSLGGELESALFCRRKALAFPLFVRNMRPLLRFAEGCGRGLDPIRDMIGFQDLARFWLPSVSARNTSHFVLLASPESRLTSPHAARYSSGFDCTVRLRQLRRLTASRRAGVEQGLVFLSGLGFPTCFAAAEIMALLRRRMQMRNS